MKILNDNTIKQLGNGIIDKIRGRYNAYFIGTYDTATGGIDFANTLYNRIDKLAVNVGDCIIVNHQNIRGPVYYAGTSTINFDIDIPYTVFTVINISERLGGSIYIDALDKAGNKVSINSENGSTFFIELKEPIVPITWNHTTWKSNNRIQSLVLDSNFLKFKEGDKIKFGSANDENFFDNATVEIKEITISDYIDEIDGTHFSAIFTLSHAFKNSEVVDMRCSVALNGNTYTEKQRRITTNCPTYILGVLNNTGSSLTSCQSIFLPKSNVLLDAMLYSNYYPKPGDIVCSITDNVQNMNYSGNIIYIDFNASNPYVIINFGLMAQGEFLIIGNSFIEKNSGGGNTGGGVS